MTHLHFRNQLQAPTRSRRGVLLLVVLSLLTLFMLLGTTFLLLASRARTTARAYLKLAENTTRSSASYTPLLHEAAMQVIRGPSPASSSALQQHDLLRDRYGMAGTEFEIRSPDFVGAGQLLRFTIARPGGAAATVGNFSGQVLTFLTGPDALVNTSTRVVTSLDPAGNDSTTVYVLRPAQLETRAGLAGARVLLNARDFAGNGILGDASQQPNFALGTTGLLGLPNEDYDSGDGQNMLLPSQDPATAGVSLHRPQFIDAALDYAMEPNRLPPDGDDSDHYERVMLWPRLQPDYLRTLAASSPRRDRPPEERADLEIASRFRRASLRPFAFDHTPDGNYDFAGQYIALPRPGESRRPLDPLRRGQDLNGDLLLDTFGDVDSDGDGVLDSVWLDLGMAAIQLPDRTIVKPLFAIKCIDLGGRVNLNAHGSGAHLRPSPDVDELEGSKSGDDFPRPRPGLGFGPLDVRIDAVIGAEGLRRTIYGPAEGGQTGPLSRDGVSRRLAPMAGRYGKSPDAGPSLPTAKTARGWTARQGLPADWLDPTTWLDPEKSAGLYGGSPPDFWSRFGVALDRWGRPLFLPMDGTEQATGELDSPYALDLTQPKVGDPLLAPADTPSPFSPAELAALLRPYDSDNTAILPQRLVALNLSRGPGVPNLRDTCTTESWDTPAVIGGLPSFMTASNRPLFDPELARGLRMNLNRPFGDLEDNDADGLVDEPDEPDNFADLEKYPAGTEDTGTDAMSRLLRGSLPAEMQPQPAADTPGMRARQLFVFHLFNLVSRMPALGGDSLKLFAGGWSNNGEDFTKREPGLSDAGHNSRVLAQWAVNVVDFMDPDAIMTPFRYGLDPRDVVWGCEAPDLIITETLALHDRGVADREEGGFLGAGASDDNDWDQVRRPRGSLFVELHAVRGRRLTKNEPDRGLREGDPDPRGLPRELYTREGLLDLSRRPDGTPSNGPPVWRLAMTGLRQQPADPLGNDLAIWANQDIFARLMRYPDSEWLSPGTDRAGDGIVAGIGLTRFAWFGGGCNQSPGSAIGAANTNNTYCDARGPNNATNLVPGDFLVLAPRVVTPIGDRNGDTPADSAQRIEWDYRTGRRFETTDFAGEVNAPTGLAELRAKSETKACVLEMPIPGGTDVSGLNVSEPLADNYYADEEGFFASPKDDLTPDPVAIKTQGTHINAATVFLQRLADPTRPHDPNLLDPNDPSEMNPAWNPYVTVDFQPIDLHVLNGSEDYNTPEEMIVGGVKVPTYGPNRPLFLHTRQRGLAFDSAGSPIGSFLSDSRPFKRRDAIYREGNDPLPALASNPWLPGYPEDANNPPGPRQMAALGGANAYVPFLLNRTDSNRDQDRSPFHTLGFTNASFGGRLMGNVAGAPTTPFPWIVWNDRPFASEFELLLVPRTAPGRLLTNYRNPTVDPVGNRDPFESSIANDSYDVYGVAGRAGHLMPFTAINDPAVPMPGNVPLQFRARNADLLSRLFQYVRVPSPYEGTTRRVLEAAGGPVDPVAEQLLAPFDALPTFREPGRINVNTIPRTTTGSGIWNALLGLGSATLATEAAPPWKSDDSSVPDMVGRWNAISGPVSPDAPLLRQTNASIDFGIDDENDPIQTPPRAFSLLGDMPPPEDEETPPPEDEETPQLEALFGPQGQAELPDDGEQYTYAQRNAWFAYQPLIRAASNSSPRSEVYAIWVTMGFFEVERVEKIQTVLPDGQPFVVYPDGYKLLREYGTQKGDVRRHRAFYLFDRSIPVGYEPGVNHNVRDAILSENVVD